MFFGFSVFIILISIIFKSFIIKNRNGVRNYDTSNTYTISEPQAQSGKYRPITSHYSKETLKGVDINNNNIGSKQKKATPSALAGQFVPNGQLAINNANTNINMNQNSVKNSAQNQEQAHNHAYEHKVEPIDEASVHDLFEDRKEAYRERKAQMKADLPKTSYSEVKEKIKASNSGKYREIQRNSAKNGDNGCVPGSGETSIKCEYCGANNIVPHSRNIKYNCYFCREEI